MIWDLDWSFSVFLFHIVFLFSDLFSSPYLVFCWLHNAFSVSWVGRVSLQIATLLCHQILWVVKQPRWGGLRARVSIISAIVFLVASFWRWRTTLRQNLADFFSRKSIDKDEAIVLWKIICLVNKHSLLSLFVEHLQTDWKLSFLYFQPCVFGFG